MARISDMQQESQPENSLVDRLPFTVVNSNFIDHVLYHVSRAMASRDLDPRNSTLVFEISEYRLAVAGIEGAVRLIEEADVLNYIQACERRVIELRMKISSGDMTQIELEQALDESSRLLEFAANALEGVING